MENSKNRMYAKDGTEMLEKLRKRSWKCFVKYVNSIYENDTETQARCQIINAEELEA